MSLTNMTLKECIEYVDRNKPNAFSNEDKTRWINEIEGRIQSKIFLFGPDSIVQYDWDTQKNAELFVKPPHQALYYEYLYWRIDYNNGEYDKAQNSKASFDTLYNEFRKWFIEEYHPADYLNRGGCSCCTE